MISFPSDAKSWLGKLVSFDTTSYKSNLPLLDYVRDYLKTFNIESIYVYNPEKTHANLFATITASDGSTQGGIILSGHIDVVPVDGQKWDTDPFTMIEKDGKLFGRGTCDMKGFLAVALSLVPMFVKMHKSKSIHFAFSFDEEVKCTGIQYLLKYFRENKFTANACLVGEPTGMKVITGNKGIASWKVIVHGKAIHSSLALMNTSCNAIEYAAKIITKIREIALKLREEGIRDNAYECSFENITTGIIEGGNAVNTVPAECYFTFNIRLIRMETAELVEREVKSYINDVILPEMRKEYADAAIDFHRRSFDLPYSADENDRFTLMCRECLNNNNNKSEVRKMGGFTEASYYQTGYNIPTVIIGPGEIYMAHKPNEYIQVESLGECTSFVTRLLHKFCIDN